jgi:hypothetical protein
MKKLSILVGAALGSVILLSGCNLFGTVDEVTGVLSRQEAVDEYAGTHLITDEDGDVYALNSTSLNLSSQQYVGNKVKVNVDYDKENEVYSVTGVSVLEVLDKENGKANWVSYMNQDVGFRWKFYDNWDIMESSDRVKLFGPTQLEGIELDEDTSIGITPDVVIVEKRLRGESQTMEELINSKGLELFGKNAAEDYNVSDAKIGTNLQSAVKWDLKAGTEVHYFLERDHFIYSISFYPLEGADDSNWRSFHEMVLEFQFVPFEDSEDPVVEEEDTAPPSEPVFEPEELIEDEPEDEPKSAPEAAPAPTTENDYNYSSYAEFESLPYHFTANYPASWYYSGASGSEDGVLHKYAFSDEAVTDDNEFASLKVLSGGIPNGHSLDLPNGIGRKVYDLPKVTVYVEIEDVLYSAEGPKEIEETLIQIISSITPVDSE